MSISRTSEMTWAMTGCKKYFQNMVSTTFKVVGSELKYEAVPARKPEENSLEPENSSAVALWKLQTLSLWPNTPLMVVSAWRKACFTSRKDCECQGHDGQHRPLKGLWICQLWKAWRCSEGKTIFAFLKNWSFGGLNTHLGFLFPLTKVSSW